MHFPISSNPVGCSCYIGCCYRCPPVCCKSQTIAFERTLFCFYFNFCFYFTLRFKKIYIFTVLMVTVPGICHVCSSSSKKSLKPPSTIMLTGLMSLHVIFKFFLFYLSSPDEGSLKYVFRCYCSLQLCTSCHTVGCAGWSGWTGRATLACTPAYDFILNFHNIVVHPNRTFQITRNKLLFLWLCLILVLI